MDGMTAQKVAVLDLGTNTFNLLLVKITPKAYYIFHNEKVPVKIGEGGINKRIITKEAKERALKALQYYKNIIRSEKISKIYGYATSAFRNANNGIDLKNQIEREINLPIDIISGELEAGFIYEGVKTAIDIGGDYSLIMDIGGGSVEFIIGNRDRAVWKRSFDIGAQRLLDWYHKHDPIPLEEINKLDEYFEKELSELAENVKKYNPTCLIGSSGTFDTLSEIYQHQINRFLKGDETELPLTPKGFERIHQQIITKNKKERLNIKGMLEMRVDMIVVASCLVKYVIDKFSISQIRVSSHSLKEGMISVIQSEMSNEKPISKIGN